MTGLDGVRNLNGRVVLSCGMALALLMAGSAEASHRPFKKPPVKAAKTVKKEAPPKQLNVPIVAVSIGSQRVTVFDKGIAVASAPVSTGTPSHPTPTGIFSIIQKRKVHYSNLYGAAPMPFMQRITWSGVALHAGVLPGRPASHGCIRLPRDFAVRLWTMTRMGARVIVARNDVVPQEFAHPRLFVLKKPVETSKLDPAAPTVVAEGERQAISDAAPAALPAGVQSAAEPARPAEAAIPELRLGSAVAPDALRADFQAAPNSEETGAGREAPPRQLRAGPVSVFVSRKENKLYVRKGFEPIFDMPVTIAQPESPLGTHVFTATELLEDGTSFRWLAVSMHTSPPKASKSRREGKKPAKSVKPATALLPPPATVSEALERIEIPAEAVERISLMMSPGASLIISDQGLGSETGKETDFVVLTR